MRKGRGLTSFMGVAYTPLLAMPLNSSVKGSSYSFSNSRKFCLLAVAITVLIPLLVYKRYFYVDTESPDTKGTDTGDSLKMEGDEIPQKVLSEQRDVKVQQKYQEVKVCIIALNISVFGVIKCHTVKKSI